MSFSGVWTEKLPIPFFFFSLVIFIIPETGPSPPMEVPSAEGPPPTGGGPDWKRLAPPFLKRFFLSRRNAEPKCVLVIV